MKINYLVGNVSKTIWKYIWLDRKYLLYRRTSKKYDENSSVRYILETDINYPKELGLSHNELLYLKKWKLIKKSH